MFPENHRFQVPAEAHWWEIRKVSPDVGWALQQAMRAIETANPDKKEKGKKGSVLDIDT